MQAQPPRSAPQPPGFLALLLLEGLPETLGSDRRSLADGAAGRLDLPAAGLIQPIKTLLNQHLGHVADRARLGLGDGGETLAELFGQDHLDTR